MARTNKTTKASKSTKTYKPANKSSKPTKLSFLQQKVNTKLVVFVLIFAALGTYFLIRSRANQGVGFKLAQVAANLTTGNGSPRVVRETSGNKRNADVVLVDAGQNQTNHVYVTYNATSAGIYKICGFGRRNDGGTAKLYAANAPYPYTTITRPESYIVADYPVTTGTDYKNVCTSLELKRAGTVYISNVVTSGTWNFSINTLERTGDLPPLPPPTGFPTPATTGWKPTGVTLTPYTGPCEITQDNTIIDSKDISCTLSIQANNVTIKRSRIQAGSSWWGILFRTGDNLTVQNVEVTSKSVSSQTSWGIQAYDGTNMTIERSLIHNVTRGIGPGKGTKVLNSYIGDFNCGPEGDLYSRCEEHANGIGTFGGTDDVTIKGNSVACGPAKVACTSAIAILPQNPMGGPNDNWLVEGNLLNTTGGYCLSTGPTHDGEKPNTNTRFINNTFGNRYSAKCGIYGFANWANEKVGPAPNANGNVFSGNKDANGNTVSL